MKNYQKLKQIIQEANPEIMRLDIGCEIKINIPINNIDSEIFTGIVASRLENDICLIAFSGDLLLDTIDIFEENEDGSRKWDEENKSIFPHEDCSYLILGRLIRLADVLLAIGKNRGVMIGASGDFYTDLSGVMRAKWNLKDDNLDNQSEETKKFLEDLLTVKTQI